MEKYFTLEMCEKLHEANRLDYSRIDRFWMETYYKDKYEKRWKYIGRYMPSPDSDGIIRRYKEKTYIVVVNYLGDYERFLVTDEIKQLLNI